MLPIASVQRFPMWIVGETEKGQKTLTGVPQSNDQVGWVDPLSFNELWIPSGSPTPQMTLSLGMLIKDGNPRYLMPAMDVSVSKGGHSWRNRGMNSFPVAHSWQHIGGTLGGQLTLSMYASRNVKEGVGSSMWYAIEEKRGIADAITAIVGALADPPEGVEIGEGFHFLVAQVPGAVSSPTPVNGQVRIFLTDFDSPSGLLEVEDSDGAELSMSVVEVASAAESDYLPDVYKALYHDDQ
ncbi:unnamed protein product [Choristocarpus tenellus]